MRSRMNHTVSVRAVHAHAASLVEEHLKIQDHGRKCFITASQGRVSTDAVIKHFDIFEETLPRFFSRLVVFQVNQLLLQRRKETQ